jgi:hypothetical protein
VRSNATFVAELPYFGLGLGVKRENTKKKPYRIFIGAVSMRWRVENSIAARRTISVGSWVFLVDEWDRHLRWPVEEVRLGSIVAV